MSSPLMRPAFWVCAFIVSVQQASTQPARIEVGAKNIVHRDEKLVRRESLKEVSDHSLKQSPENLEGVDVIGPNDPTAAPGSESGGVTLAPDPTPAPPPTPPPPPTPAPVGGPSPAPTPTPAAPGTPAPTPAPVEMAAGQSYAYSDAVIASNPVVFYPMNTSYAAPGVYCDGRQCQMGTTCTALNTLACGFGPACSGNGGMAFGDPCRVDAKLMGATRPTSVAGLIHSCNTDKATSFSGAADEEVVLPDNPAINTNQNGYSRRTIELWFQVAATGPGAIARTIYAEGNQDHSGLNLYVEEDTAGVHLWAYAWDRANAATEFGTTLLSPDPIGCIIQKDQPYYAAMVFDAPNRVFRTYISGTSGVTMCGENTDLPNGVILKHHEDGGGGKPTLGGIEVSSRTSGLDTGNMTGSSHNFQGIIDEAAIYNRALPLTELQAHYSLATR